MKSKTVRISCLLLAGLLALGCFVGCGDPDEGGDGNVTLGEVDTTDEVSMALDALGPIDWGNETFAILTSTSYKSEIFAENGIVSADDSAGQIINDAVYERNILLGERCNLTFEPLIVDDSTTMNRMMLEAQAPTGEFQLIDAHTKDTATQGTNGYLYNYLDLDIDLDQPWWDSGTADFCLGGNVFFMNGANNFYDDECTYVILFNKDMREDYAATIPDPYQTVRDWEWTLEYFNQVIQGVSTDNGDSRWDEKDTYGFLTTWEYGNTLFIGSDLRYISTSREDDEPTLFLSDGGQMIKAQDVLDLAQTIYHNNNATYMSPAGQEDNGKTAFKEERGLFLGEICENLAILRAETSIDYGVLPVPKYDKDQEFYRTWSHERGSTLSITAAIPDSKAETVGKIIEAFAILSYQKVKPAYYDITLGSQNINDPDSKEMLDIIFANRVYDLALYYASEFGFYDLFKNSVNNNQDNFSSMYVSPSQKFPTVVQNILNKVG